MGFLQDLQEEFNATNNNTSEKYSQNELFTIDTQNREKFKLRFFFILLIFLIMFLKYELFLYLEVNSFIGFFEPLRAKSIK